MRAFARLVAFVICLLPFLAQAQPYPPSPYLFLNQAHTWGATQTFSGSLASTNGIFSGLLQNTQAADTYVVTGNPRNVLMQTTLSPSANTNTIWENDNSFVYIYGPGQQIGEVNGVHAYIEVEAGANSQTNENFEASSNNYGSASSTSYLSLIANTSTGTETGAVGLGLRVINNNTTAGSFSQYSGIDLEALSGTGSVPTNFYFLRNAESRAAISTLGSLSIGTLTAAPKGYFVFVGPDTSAGTFGFQVLNSSGTNLLQITDGGQIYVGASTTQGAVCSGTPTSGFATVNGIVTHC